MGVKVKRAMEKEESGVERQVYYVTHVAAVEGLEAALAGNNLKIGVTSVNNKTGVVTLTAEDLGIGIANEESSGLITADMYKKLMILLDNPSNGGTSISLEKVEE